MRSGFSSRCSTISGPATTCGFSGRGRPRTGRRPWPSKRRGPGVKIAEALAHHGIMAGGGDFYAVRPLAGDGGRSRKGVLRLSFVHYTDEGRG
jgi:hypothetical protein